MRIIQQWSDIFHDSKLILDISGVATVAVWAPKKCIVLFTADPDQTVPI